MPGWPRSGKPEAGTRRRCTPRAISSSFWAWLYRAPCGLTNRIGSTGAIGQMLQSGNLVEDQTLDFLGRGRLHAPAETLAIGEAGVSADHDAGLGGQAERLADRSGVAGMGAAADAGGGHAVEQGPIVGKAFAKVGVEIDGSGLTPVRTASESLIAPVLEFLGVDRLKLDPVACADREILRVGVGDQERGSAQQVPAAGRLAGIDARLTAGDGDRAGGNLQPGRVAARQARRGQGGDNRRKESPAGSRWRRRRTRPRCAARRARRDRASNERPPRRGPAHRSRTGIVRVFPSGSCADPGSMVPSSCSSASRLGLVGIGEDGGRTIGQDDVGHSLKRSAADGENPRGRLSLGGEPGQVRSITQRLERAPWGISLVDATVRIQREHP